jgi:biotin transport system substrate-specific component
MSQFVQLPATGPFGVKDDQRLLKAATALVLGNLLLWASAKAQVPFWPVPVTLQTYVVLVLGPVLGWRLGGATVAAYLIEGAIGLPVFAGTPAHGIGFAYIAGPTGGYLMGYLAAVLMVGFLEEQNRSGSVAASVAELIVGELLILGFGCTWLAVLFGWERAFAFGFGPFLLGDAVKLALAGATIALLGSLRRRSRQD